MKKYIAIVGVLFALALVAVLVQRGVPQSTDTLPEQNALDAQAPQTTDSNQETSDLGPVFNADTVKAGDVVGAFTVVDVQPFRAEMTSLPRSQNIRVRFATQFPVEGTFEPHREDSERQMSFIRFSLPYPFPYQGGDDFQIHGACIAKESIVDPSFHHGDVVKATITEYTYTSYPAGGCRGIIRVERVERNAK
ncbi:MAG TPA: hypothetical protein VJK53_04445 [Candidatus Paceibacterota bacterium]